MENIKKLKKISKKDIKLLSNTFSDISMFNPILRLKNKTHNSPKKNYNIIPKNELPNNNDLISNQHSSRLIKNNTPKILFKYKQKINFSPEIKKCDASTQKDYFTNNRNKISQIKSGILKKLIENYPNKNSLAIDYVLESPHRGVEKIAYSNSISKSDLKKNKSLFSPIFVNNTYKGYFLKTNKSYLSNNKHKEIIIDKYDNKNKKVNNPLEKLSKMSGVSCYKLRKVIDYSLSHKFKYMDKREQTKKRLFNKNNRYKYKNIYSIITLKSNKNKNCEIFKGYNSVDLDYDASLENVISPRKIFNIKPFIGVSPK